MNEESIRGTVVEVRPKNLFRVRLDDGRVVLAGPSKTLRHLIVRLLVGEHVLLKLSENDPDRGHIIKKAE
jgi:translation initiation factor IF-1